MTYSTSFSGVEQLNKQCGSKIQQYYNFIKELFIKESLAYLENMLTSKVFSENSGRYNQITPNSISMCTSKHISSFNLRQLNRLQEEKPHNASLRIYCLYPSENSKSTLNFQTKNLRSTLEVLLSPVV